MAGKKALCVGVNKYQNLPNATLHGCVNDVKNMESILTKFMGFAAGDIVELTDDQATKTNIMKNLKEMVDGAKAGKYNYLVFSMSSHGTQVPDTSGDEPDRADEAFCPTDLIQKGNAWDPDHVIVDDELHDLFVQVPKTVMLECFLDTCHSGTGLKAIDLLFDRTPRYLPPPSLEAFLKVDGKRSHSLSKSLLESGNSSPILWAACRADQTSADANINGTWNGAFTYYLCSEMIKSQNKSSRRDLLNKVRADLKKGHYEQTPQLELDATNRGKSVAGS
ncbi:Caspase domain protein [uncultured archaeon]|nr:Caspase domain protein [uncultured archaeon]